MTRGIQLCLLGMSFATGALFAILFVSAFPPPMCVVGRGGDAIVYGTGQAIGGAGGGSWSVHVSPSGGVGVPDESGK